MREVRAVKMDPVLMNANDNLSIPIAGQKLAEAGP